MKKIIFTSFSFLIIILLFSLGTWQLIRLNWKQQLIEDISVSINKPALEVSDLAQVKSFQNIKLSGDLFKKNYFIYQLNEKGKYGFNLISLMKVNENYSVLIQRGWINSIKDEYKFNLNNEQYKLSGRVENIKPKGFFTPNNDTNLEFKYYIDVGLLETINKVKIYPFILIQTSKDGQFENIKNLQNLNISNNHLQYAITWFVLGFCILIAFCFYRKKYK